MRIIALDHAFGERRSARASDSASRAALAWLDDPKGRMQKVVSQIREVADTGLSVLVEGESGTGKELVSRAIHGLSARRTRPLVAVDCGGMPDTLIESELFGYERGAFTGAVQRKKGQFQVADGGTLFLDEILNLPLLTQAKLLRALQERQVRPLGSEHPVRFHVRIVAASQTPLKDEVQAGRFRGDLYYRLNEFQINLPPLREREDLLDLAGAFIRDASQELNRPGRVLSDEAASLLVQHRWPGNVRELRNVIRRAVLLSQRAIRPEHLSLSPAAAVSAATEWPVIDSEDGASLRSIAAAAAARAEEQAIQAALRTTRGNKTRAARLLQIDYKTLLGRLRRYEIDSQQFKDTPQVT